MARPRKCRKVCAIPHCTRFVPGTRLDHAPMVMAVDEYETIRLIDYEEMTQEQCAEQMNVGRATAQLIYASARKKLAQCIVDGLELRIDGGDYSVCEQRGCGCDKDCCRRKQNLLRNGKET